MAEQRARLRVTVSEEGVTQIEGDNARYVRDLRNWYLTIKKPRISQVIATDMHAPYVADRQPPMVHDLQVRGEAHLEKYEWVQLAGWGDKTDRLPVVIRCHRDNMSGKELGAEVWSACIGFIPRDEESLRSKDAWFLELVVPREAIEQLVSALRASEADEILVGIYPVAHVQKGDNHAPIGYPITRYILPDQRYEGSSWPGTIKGPVTQLSWHQAPAVAPEQPRPQPSREDPFANPPPPAKPDPAEVLAKRVELLRGAISSAAWILAAAIVIAALIP